jgi:hypothetical protein
MDFLKAKVKKKSAKTQSQIMRTWSFKGLVLLPLPLYPQLNVIFEPPCGSNLHILGAREIMVPS